MSQLQNSAVWCSLAISGWRYWWWPVTICNSHCSNNKDSYDTWR